MTAIWIMFGLLIVAVVGWMVAVLAAISLVRLAPAGRKAANYTRLSLFRFAAIRAELGDSAGPFIRNYRNGIAIFLVSFAVIILLAVVIPGNPVG